MNSAGNTTVARLVCNEATAKRLADSLSEHLGPVPRPRWRPSRAPTGAGTSKSISRTPPDEAAVRRLIGDGRRSAADVTFETIAARDWVAASLADLKPVTAGRFTVHGAHDRAHVTANRIGIEIEAALAFGTGHHGTTRGCLLALDGIVKRRLAAAHSRHRHRHRRARHRGRESAARARARHRHRSGGGAHRARERAPQRRRAVGASACTPRASARRGFARARRSTWCSPISCWRRSSASPARCGRCSRRARTSCCPGCSPRRRRPRSPPTGRTG